MKAGAVVAGLAYGVLPYLIGAVAVATAAAPYGAEVINFAIKKEANQQFDDNPSEWLSIHTPPVSAVRLKGEIADGYAAEKEFARQIGASYCWNVVLYKIIWEHIRVTGSRAYKGTLTVKADDVRRQLSGAERKQFLVFLENGGNMSTEDVKRSQQ